MPKTYVLVADAARARVFALEEAAGVLREVFCVSHPEARLPGAAFARDRASRVHDRQGHHRHAAEPRHDPSDEENRRFAAELVATLEGMRARAELDRLVMFAPPRFLGQLRGLLSQDLQRMVVHELDRDFTLAGPEVLRAHVPRGLWDAPATDA
jgi:protein required for attachment to host cells